ncbi:MAG: hypothetical protein MUF51_10185 [Vicinamibacteria bacterium]|nr:hypothetical protein [Vicinamibacteria bacterium]
MSEPNPSERTIKYVYRFEFPDGSHQQYSVFLEYATLTILPPPRTSYPEWTALEYKKCPHCPLDPAKNPRCPIAANLVDVVAFLKDWRSFDQVDTIVIARNRTYSKRTSLQEAASALLGIFMVASGCPILNKLRPMLATHLPFMDSDESTFRTISMYLTAQYFLAKNGRPADWSLANMLPFLKDCHMANAGICERLRSLGIRDAVLNALAVLNMQGELTCITLETGDFDRWRRVFAEHYF